MCKTLPAFLLIPLAVIGLAALAAAPGRGDSAAHAAPGLQPTPFQTPTPGPDGRIIYVVQEGDSPWAIAAIAGIPLEQLYALNGMQPGDFINPGDRLVLGIGGPVIPTAPPGSAPTPTSIAANPTPSMNYPVHLDPGATKYVEFGAQPSGGGGGGDSTTSTLLGIIGVAMLLAGGGLGYYAARSRRPDRLSFRNKV